MHPVDLASETISYRVLIVAPFSRDAFVLREDARKNLPIVRVPRQSRHALELRTLLHTLWQLTTFVCGFIRDSTSVDTNYAIVELLDASYSARLTAVPLHRLIEQQFSGPAHDAVLAYLTGTSPNAMFRIGWVDDAIRWIESVTHCTVPEKACLEQVHVGIGFCLMKVPLQDRRPCWFKAMGHPNTHETAITRLLSHASSPTASFLPRLLGFHETWNALLMEDGGVSLDALLTDSATIDHWLSDVVISLARLQDASIPQVAPLLEAGAISQSFARIVAHAGGLCDFLERAMSHQTSQHAPRIERQRLHDIFQAVEDTCVYLDRLDIPACLVHGDLNAGNILYGGPCLFIDWCETYIGHPFVCLQHVFLLHRADDPREHQSVRNKLITLYCDTWSPSVERWRLDAAVSRMPLIAAVSTLYGRGDWLDTPEEHSPTRFAYARTLARHMDRAVQALTQGGA